MMTAYPEPQGIKVERTVRVAAIPTFVVFVSCLYFYSGGGWNQSSHFDLARAIAERGSIVIDPYRENTGDVSSYDGHYYSNKPPGTALTAVPAVAFIFFGARAVGLRTTEESVLFWAARAATLVCASIPTAAVVFLIIAITLRQGATVGAAAFSGIAFGLGSPAWAYGTTMWGHSLAAACLLASYALATSKGSSGSDAAAGLWLGLFSGWAVLTEYQALGASLVIAALGLWKVRIAGRAAIGTRLLSIALGAAIPATIMFTYHFIAFGSPFRVSYQFSQTLDAAGARQAGVGCPRIDVLGELLFGTYRGLIPSAPIFLGAPIGFVSLWKDPARRLPAIGAVAVFIYYLLTNSALSYWNAGWCFGPRYLLPGMAFLAIGLFPAWSLVSEKTRLPLLMILGASILTNLIAVSTNPFPDDSIRSPFFSDMLPAFCDGRLSLNHSAFMTCLPSPAFNLGELIGLTGLASLLPLVFVFILAYLAWMKLVGKAISGRDMEGPKP